jgi:hypothetical protein
MVVFYWSYHFLSVYTNKYKRLTLKYNACKGNETAFPNGTFYNPTKTYPLQIEHRKNNLLFLVTILYRMGWEPLLQTEIVMKRTYSFIVSFASAFRLTSIVSGPFVMCKHTF